ncbi:hypothetical protein QYE76_071593 [Lolium multiflorum]|uniref:Uncharacterized protein n=1 Tax=Lolium multiflorum TaxID=4521 RepID=A0AAD8SLU6_LOLMU|nr:hypothetical protein QYE76_071593 [Lolium multiflorum]
MPADAAELMPSADSSEPWSLGLSLGIDQRGGGTHGLDDQAERVHRVHEEVVRQLAAVHAAAQPAANAEAHQQRRGWRDQRSPRAAPCTGATWPSSLAFCSCVDVASVRRKQQRCHR